jgi:hypothetical protein
VRVVRRHLLPPPFLPPSSFWPSCARTTAALATALSGWTATAASVTTHVSQDSRADGCTNACRESARQTSLSTERAAHHAYSDRRAHGPKMPLWTPHVVQQCCSGPRPRTCSQGTKGLTSAMVLRASPVGHLVSPESSTCCIVAMAAGSSGVDRRALVGASVGLEYGGRPSAGAGDVDEVPAATAAAAIGVVMPPLATHAPCSTNRPVGRDRRLRGWERG